MPHPVAGRIQVGAVLTLLARSPAVAARILAVVLLILLARIPVAARIQAVVLLILLVRGPVAARIQPAVLLILLVRIPVVARIQAQRRTSARTIRLRRNARRMRHKVISQGNTLPQPTISMPTLRTAISTLTSEAML
jgi:hypothetical protein